MGNLVEFDMTILSECGRGSPLLCYHMGQHHLQSLQNSKFDPLTMLIMKITAVSVAEIKIH